MVRFVLTGRCVPDLTLFPYSSVFSIMALFMDIAPCTSQTALLDLPSAQVAEKLILYVTHCGFDILIKLSLTRVSVLTFNMETIGSA